MTELILASQSASRRKILEAAGIQIRAMQPALDEDAAKAEILAKHPAATPLEMARELAGRKALSLSWQYPDAIVIGGDQVLSLDGHRYDKPRNLSEARAHLLQLRGKTHYLETAIACARNGAIIWSCATRPALEMHAFDDAALEAYLQIAGAGVTETVGAYKLEGPAIQLFKKIDGDYFSILGMPLLELLEFLRQQAVIP